MIKDWADLCASVVDTQPAFNMLLVANGANDTYPDEMRAFARFKVEEAIRTMQDAAKYLRRNLAPPPSSADRGTK